MPRQIDAHGRALPHFGIDPHLAARLLRETINHRQPEARALADRLGRKERLERARHDVRRHPHTRIADGQGQVLALCHILLARDALVDPLVGRFDRDGAAIGHGVARIDAQVQ